MKFSFEICLLWIFSIVQIINGATDDTQSKALCYSGSSLYQLLTQNCNKKDESYSGTWYCAKMEICEAYISDKRQCVTTRGCATEKQCTTSSGSIYNGENVESVPGTLPAGMTMTATCCEAHDFPNDDTLAIDYSDICNSASRSSMSVWVTSFVIFCTMLVFFVV